MKFTTLILAVSRLFGLYESASLVSIRPTKSILVINKRAVTCRPLSLAWNPGASQIGFIAGGDCGLFLSPAVSGGFVTAAALSHEEMSCTSQGKICSVSSATSFSEGLLVLDLHRLDRFKVSPGSFVFDSGQSVNVGSLIVSYGQASVPTNLKYPASLCVYEPFNATHVASGSDPVFNSPYRIVTQIDGGSYVFVADSGNDRVCAFNMTGSQQLDMMTCVSISDPLFLSIMFGPSWEPGVSAANIFVTTLSKTFVKVDFSSVDASLSVSGQLDLPCPGKGVDVLNGEILVVVIKCDDNTTSGIAAISVDIYNTSRMYMVDFFHAPSNVFLYGPILVTAPDITGQKSIITTGGYLDSLSISSLFITLSLPRSITIRDRPTLALNFVKTCFNVTSPIGPPRFLIEEACETFNVSSSIIDTLFANGSFNYTLLQEIFFKPYRRVVINCLTDTSNTGGTGGSNRTQHSITDLSISTNGCLVIVIITAFVL